MTENRLATRTALFAVLAALAAFGLVACGSDPSSSAEPGSNAGSSSSDGSASGLACPEGKLAAEGSSAQGNAITEVIASYNAECGDKASIEYNPTGSGAGIKSFYNGLVDFAGSDSALKTEEKDGVVESDKAKERCQGNPAWNLPMVTGPIAFAYNIDGVDKLVLNAEVLAGIFNGNIKTWDDEKIAKLNSGAQLPGEKIIVFFRSMSRAPPRTRRSSSPRPATASGRTSQPRLGPVPVKARTSRLGLLRVSRTPRTPSRTWSGATPRTTTSRWRSWTVARAPWN